MAKVQIKSDIAIPLKEYLPSCNIFNAIPSHMGKLKELKNPCTYTEKTYFCTHKANEVIIASKR